jgi:hypothetical protein
MSERIQVNVDSLIKKDFDSLKSDFKTGHDFIKDLLYVYSLNRNLKSFDSDKLMKVAEIKGLSMYQVIQEALIDYTKKVLKADKKGFKTHSKSLKADEAIDTIVKNMMNHNDKNIKDRLNQIFINQTAIYKWINDHKLSLINIEVIKRYLRLHSVFIKEHHEKHDLLSSHNRQSFIKKRFNNEKTE